VDDEILAEEENAGEKLVLCYESDPRYAESIRSILEDFDIPLTMAQDESEFFRELDDLSYTFAFVSASLAETAGRRIREKSLAVILVVLAHLGEIVSTRNLPTILMPAWAIPVANILNYKSQLDRRTRGRARFIVPDARILIVDDITTNLKVIEGFLTFYKCRIATATGGSEAVGMVRQNHYDLVFMDHMMPGMDGIEAVEAIRAIEGDYYRNLPIVALTANAVVGMREMFLEKGFNDYLSKPIEIAKLDAIMDIWLPRNMQHRGEDALGENARGDEHRKEAPAESSGHPPGFEVKEPLDGKAIQGIDLNQARERYGSDEAYLEVLRFYAAETAQLLEKLRVVTAETLPDYAVTVHGIKGSSNGICATEVGQRAQVLENAAKAGDAAFVASHNGPFLETAGELIVNIRRLLESFAPSPNQEKARSEAPDPALLSLFLEACKNYDTEGMGKALGALEARTYDRDGDLVEWLRDQLDALEYDAIRERLESYQE
jgi:CheY-like chemotaxis protein